MNKPLTALFVFILVSFDQASKLWISSVLELGESLNLLPFLNFILIHNKGIAFSMFNDGGNLFRWILVVLIFILVIYLFFLLLKETNRHFLEYSSLLLISCGGLGNLIDRIISGYVIDFIHVYYQHYSFYVFNLADSFITLGVIIYLIYFFFLEGIKDK